MTNKEVMKYMLETPNNIEEDKTEIVALIKEEINSGEVSGDYTPVVLTADFYGDELPELGTPDQIFFKRVIV